ncbi:MAG: SDR family NAD(P)-dependent oxidoreductase [Acidobacteriota bacterium]|nr:SDR family NAD(P)-dependent oxidoreductase [Acidobacteriota bacterium]
MTITLITGANKGLGREAARRLVEAGHVVYVGARNEAGGAATALEVGGRFVALDVLDESSVATAAAAIEAEHGRLDVLINNAGIAGGTVLASETTAEDVERVYATNVFGVVRVTHAFLPLLVRSPAPVIVNVSSGLGSLAVTNNPARFESTLKMIAYPSSKAALNMLTSQYAKSFPQIRVNAVDPGYTATDLNGHRGSQTVEEGAEIIVSMASIGADGPTGGFFDRHGVVPW